MENIRIYCGFDKRQPVAFNVLSHSIWSRASRPVSIQPLVLSQLPITRTGLTEFTYSRFLVPWLSGYDGYSIFMDADVLCLSDVTKILDGIDPRAAVSVSQNKLKFEWASVMVFHNNLCRQLTPEFVQDGNNKLFDFAWTKDIGRLDPEWNHLVGYDEPNPNAKLVHYTQGIPCFPETKDSEFAAEWNQELKKMVSTVSWKEIMGNSVHAQPVYNRLAKVNSND